MSTKANPITAEQLWEMGDAPYELLHGKLVEVDRYHDGTHGVVTGEVLRIVGNYVDDSNSGEAYVGRVGFILGRNPDTVLGPDVAYVSQAKLDLLDRKRDYYLPTIPDIAFEIVSAFETFERVDEKAREFIDFGVPLVVVVNPRKRLLHVHRPNVDVQQVADGESFDCDDVAPGLAIDTSQLFEGV